MAKNTGLDPLPSRVPAPFSGPESLDGALDQAIEISGQDDHRRLSLVIGGEAVSWCSIIDFHQQVGPCLLRMAGLARVGTHKQHRLKGYCRRVLTSALRWMRHEGYDVSMLYGIAGMYPKFGYAEAFPQVIWRVAVRDAETAPRGTYRVVDFDPTRHLRPVLKLYRATNAERTGVTLRDPKVWAPFRLGRSYRSHGVVKCLCDGRGRVVGYLVHDSERAAEVIEAGWASPKVFGALLAAAADGAWAERAETIAFHLPPDDLFMRRARRYGLTCETTCRRDGGAMVRLINVPSALAKLADLLTARAPAGMQLNLVTNLDTAALSRRRGNVTVSPARLPGAATARLPQWALAQLLYGYADAAELHADGVLKASKRVVDLVGMLFPPTPHYHYRTDHF
ncbi:MAG: GNAT family N-acetyltransferase [Planctomycetota bacterium]